MAVKTHRLTVTAMLGAVATVLMFLEFPVPFLVPPFIKMDISELPALLAAFSLGPVYGVAVCLIKNVVNLASTYSGGVGELANFLMGAVYAYTAGAIYQHHKSRKEALIASASASVAMAAASLPINYFISYPFYQKLMPLQQILDAYGAIRPGADSLFECLLFFNLPFTLIKGVIVAALCFFIYKPLSPVLHK